MGISRSKKNFSKEIISPRKNVLRDWKYSWSILGGNSLKISLISGNKLREERYWSGFVKNWNQGTNL